MFKEQYIRDNEKLHAKETLLMEIKEKNAREKIALTPRQKFVRYGAVFAAFVLVAAGIFGTIYATKGANGATPENAALSAAADGTTPVDVESSDDIYAMIEAMQGGSDNGRAVLASGTMSDGAQVKTESATTEAPAAVASQDAAAMDASAAFRTPQKSPGAYCRYVPNGEYDSTCPSSGASFH